MYVLRKNNKKYPWIILVTPSYPIHNLLATHYLMLAEPAFASFLLFFSVLFCCLLMFMGIPADFADFLRL